MSDIKSMTREEAYEIGFKEKWKLIDGGNTHKSFFIVPKKEFVGFWRIIIMHNIVSPEEIKLAKHIIKLHNKWTSNE